MQVPPLHSQVCPGGQDSGSPGSHQVPSSTHSQSPPQGGHSQVEPSGQEVGSSGSQGGTSTMH